MPENFGNDCQTRLNGAINNAQTTLTVDNSTGFPAPNFRIRIDNEIMTVTGKSGNDWTVVRATEAVRGVQMAGAHADDAYVAHRLTAGALAGLGGSSFDAADNLFIGGGGTSVTGNVGGDLGTDNIAVGAGSIDNGTTTPGLNAVTDGIGNIAIGGSTLKACTTGSYNTCVGLACAVVLTTGSNNVCVSDYAFASLTAGDYNCALVENALHDLTTGSHNVGIGHSAGNALTTGTENTFIGHNTNTGKASVTKGIAIGYNAEVMNDKQCVFGGTGADAVCIIWAGATAPADADLVASQGSLYWDFTNGASFLKAKLKTADGTVVNRSLAMNLTPVADGTYTVGSKITPVTGANGTITVVNGIITAIQQAT